MNLLRVISAFALVLAATSGLGAAESPSPGSRPSDDTIGLAPPAGGTVLWNGRDLTGWTVFLQDPAVDPNSVWSVSGGILRLTGKPFGYLRSVGNYGNFRLHAEWRYPAGTPMTPVVPNSGVFVLVHGPNAIWPQGIECQLRAGESGQMIGTEVILPGAPFLRAKWRAPALHPSVERPFGQWNAYDIICHDQVVDVWVNGVEQNRFTGVTFKSDPGLKTLQGSILLQLEGAPIEFRNIWLERAP